MTSLIESIRQRFSPRKPLPPGTYHYQAPQEDPRNYRLHLRLEAGGEGMMIVNASTILHLNATAAEFAYHLINQTPKAEVASSVASRYRISRSAALNDYQEFIDNVDTIISTPGLDPITYLDLERHKPFEGEISAPYRLDCAITYALPDFMDPDSAPLNRVSQELSTEEWKSIMDKAWQAGIPHIIFTGGEPTLRQDLIELITHAESNGQVAGLITDGSKLSDRKYLEELLQTGLDHLLIVLYPHGEGTWLALPSIINADIFTAVHLTITEQNQDQVMETLQLLSKMGVRAVSLSENNTTLTDLLQAARELAANLDMELVWDLPVPYSSLNPVSLELEGREHPEAAGRAWLYVEPDGDILPAQGINQVLGNFLTDPWDKIWNPTEVTRES
ncbi:MAG: radical SAM protein [Anaerolineales bacterium]|nr:radical SAM protein [Anaerolineales bacterium]